MNKLLKDFGDHLRKIRIEQRLSQEQLSEKSGLHRTYLGGLERGERNPTLTTLNKIAQALNVDISLLTDFNREN
jgi:transcriptional regulator with XRE-family HTH domain